MEPYIVIGDSDLESLTTLVSTLITEDGYKPLGGVVISNGNFYQTLYKED